MTYIRKLIGRGDPLEGMEEAISNEVSAQVVAEETGPLEINIEAIHKVRNRLADRELELKAIIARFNEELRQVSIVMSGYDLALGAMEANSIDTGIRHIHKNINHEGGDNDPLATGK